MKCFNLNVYCNVQDVKVKEKICDENSNCIKFSNIFFGPGVNYDTFLINVWLAKYMCRVRFLIFWKQ